MTTPAPNQRPKSADLILSVTILLVGLTVVSLLVVLWMGARLESETQQSRATSRAARNAAIAFEQAHSDATAAQRNYLLSGDRARLPEFEAAKIEAHAELDNLRRIISSDATAMTLIARMQVLSDQDLAELDRGIANPRRAEAAPNAVLRAGINDFHAHIIRRSDIVRQNEEAGRARLNSAAIALALLALLMSALTILALRRERLQWRTLNDALIDAQAKAEASDLAKTRFLAAASHDMRQPLHALTLYVGALRRRVENPEGLDILNKMERAAASMSGMFSSLLDLARIQAAAMVPEITVFSLQETIDRVVGEFPDAEIAASHVAFDVRTDPTLLERMLRNLVSNALRHGGGDVRIDVKPAGMIAEIAVIDKGPGIAPEDQERIFGEFVRLSGRSSGEGLGLGLAIVQRIAELLKLPLELRSALGKGSSFIIHVPMVLSGTEAAPLATSDPDALRGLRILLMDDDPLALEAVSRTVSDLGAEIRACAREADVDAELRSGFEPQVMIMDLRIDGDLEGLAIAERARVRVSPNPRVIMVTGDTGPEALAALRRSGFQWLIKPVAPNDLIEAVSPQRPSYFTPTSA